MIFLRLDLAKFLQLKRYISTGFWESPSFSSINFFSSSMVGIIVHRVGSFRIRIFWSSSFSSCSCGSYSGISYTSGFHRVKFIHNLIFLGMRFLTETFYHFLGFLYHRRCFCCTKTFLKSLLLPFDCSVLQPSQHFNVAFHFDVAFHFGQELDFYSFL